MKFRITVEDLNQLKDKYSDPSAEAGFAEEKRWFGLPHYYVVILDQEKITLIEMSMTFKEKDVTIIPLSEVKHIRVSGTIQKKVLIETSNGAFEMVFKPLAVGKGAEQKALIERFARL